MKVLILALAACGTTGGDLVTFDVAASGPDGVQPGYAFTNGHGWRVALDRATLHIGAVYLNLSVPSPGAQSTACILPGVYTAEALAGRTVDVLSPAPQAFPAPGHGTTDPVQTAEVWLTGGDVNAVADPTIIADLAGTATRDGDALPFSAAITIGANRLVPSGDPARPSARPICKQRIVSPILVALAPSERGTLRLRIDPATWFADVDFTGAAPGALPDDLSTPQSQNLFTGLRSAGTNFQIAFEPRSSR